MLITLVFFVFVSLTVHKIIVKRLQARVNRKRLTLIWERLELEGEILGHFRKSNVPLYYARNAYSINASIRGEILNVSIQGPVSYFVSYDIIEDGSFKLNTMEE